MFANHPVRTALSTLRRGLAASSPIEQGWQASGVRRGVEALGAFREDFAAVFGNADRMFELGGEGAVAGDGSPAVVEHLARGLADVDHRLDGEEHAGAKLGAGAGLADMDDLRSVVEIPADAVARSEEPTSALTSLMRISYAVLCL